MADDWKPEGARELSADDWKPEGARALADAGPVEPVKAAKPGDIGALGTGLAHTARHLSFGMGDKVIAGIQALDDVRRDKTGKVTIADAYKRDLAFNDQALEASDKEHPVARWAGNAAGVAGSIAAPLGALRLSRAAGLTAAAAPTATQGLARLSLQGAKTGAQLGAIGGIGATRADNAGDYATDVGTGVASGAALGGAAPAVAMGVGKAAGYLGNKAKDLAGYLKVKSLRPTPTLGEAMESLPGGRVGVGRELLERKIGGLTKHGTAEQIEHELDKVGKSIGETAKAYDARGGPKISVSEPIERTLQHTEELNAEPTTRAAAERLASTANEYRDIYAEPITAEHALAFKRTLGDAAYKAGDQLQRSGDHVAGDYGRGLGGLERGVNSEIESAVGPEFSKANLSYRRLLGAGQAADRVASRNHSSHPLGLIPMVAGASGATHGAKEGLGAMAAAMMLEKYGAQAGARGSYNIGRGLEAIGSGLRSSVGSASTGGVSAGLTPAQEYQAALVRALRERRPQPQLMPHNALAQGDGEQ